MALRMPSPCTCVRVRVQQSPFWEGQLYRPRLDGELAADPARVAGGRVSLDAKVGVLQGNCVLDVLDIEFPCRAAGVRSLHPTRPSIQTSRGHEEPN